MRFQERFPLFFKISLPILLILLLQVNPASLAVQKALRDAQSAREEGRPAAAAAALREVMTQEPWRGDLWEQVGRDELAAGRLDEAVTALQNAAANHTLTLDGRFQLGEAYFEQHQYPLVEAIWQSLLQEGGPSQKIYERLAQLQRSQGNFAGSITTLRDWHKFAPDNPAVDFQLGLQLSVVDPQEALPLLLKAAKADSSYTAVVQTLRNGLADAVSTTNPAYAWLLIGRSLGSIEQWDLSAEAFQKVVQLEPDYGEGWAFLGEARSHLGSSGKAELERAHSLAPTSSLVNALYALYLRRQGDYPQALKFLEDVASQEPEEPTWEIEIASTLVAQGDLITAREHFEKAVQLAPNDTRYWQYLARYSVQYNVDIRGLGLPAARQAVLLAKKDPAALDTMGWTLVNLGDAASAERFLQQALDIDATYVPACLHLGQLYLQQQDSGRAYPLIKRAANLAGNDSIGDTARRLLQRYFGEGG